MKIDTSGLNLATIGQDISTQLKGTRAQASRVSDGDGDDRQPGLSASASTMAAQLQSAPGIRTAKVAALQQAVASGSYQVDAAALATSMMRELA